MGIFSIFNNKLRCPSCGYVGNHPKSAASQSDKNINEMKASIYNALPKNSLIRKIGEDEIENGNFRCLKCSEIFTKHLSETWKKIASKHGEKVALDEYKNS